MLHAKTNVTSADLLKLQLNKYGGIDIPSAGSSMLPLIRPGDVCTFIPIEPDRLKAGDIVLYMADNGQLVGHRLVGITEQGNETVFVLQGDSSVVQDEPVYGSQIIARMESFRRGRWSIRTGGWLPRMWGALLLRYPQVRRLLPTRPRSK